MTVTSQVYVYVLNTLTVIDISNYHHHIYATGALYVSSIRLISASLNRAALASSSNASTPYLSNIPALAIIPLRS
jgi:hypothetical protein